jgi:hypothetical protein
VRRSLIFSTLAALVLSLAGTGCSNPSDNNPKAPANAPTMKKQTPAGGGAPNQMPKPD